MVNKKPKAKTKTKPTNTLREDIKKTTQKVVESPVAKKIKEVSKEVEKTLDKIVEEGEKGIKQTVENVKKKTIKSDVFVEFCGKQLLVEEIEKRAYEKIEEKFDMINVKSIKLYFKVEECKVYCLINDTDTLELEL